MKYFWTSIRPRKANELLLEAVNPAKTRHIRGYGSGVTFSTKRFTWCHSISSNAGTLQFSDPTVAAQ